MFYFASVLVALAFTELGKPSFATTRPASPMKAINDQNAKRATWIQRYGPLVQSLKSKVSKWRFGTSYESLHVFVEICSCAMIYTRQVLLGLFFVPWAAFAKVFYWCHWI
jgi:hypothetical protein